MNQLSDKVVIIVGGAGLLGKEFARAAASEGARVVIGELAVDEARRARDLLIAEFPRAFIACEEVDIRSAASVEALIDRVSGSCGSIDGVVNCAYPRNKNYGRSLFEVTYEDFCENVSMHLGGYFLVCQKFSQFFKMQGRGTVVNVASIYGTMTPRFELYEGSAMTMPVEYAAIKAAIIHLTKYFARYLQGSGVRIVSLSPGGILNGQADAFVSRYNRLGLTKGMLDPRDVAGTLVFLLSEASQYINGQNIIVDDGISL